MRAIIAIFSFFLFGIGNLIPGYSSEIDLQSDLLNATDQLFELHLRATDDFVYTDSDPSNRRNDRSIESNLAETNEEELNSSESFGKTGGDHSSEGLYTNPGVNFNQDTAVLNHAVRQSTIITPNTPIYLLHEVFRI